MAQIDAATEERIAERRSRLRQDKKVPLLIRDDGMLYPNTKLVAKKQNFRPYHGNPKASLQDRLRYLKGLGAQRAVVYTEEPEEPFDIGKADADALVQFAMEQWGAVLDPAKPLKVLRSEVFKLSQLPEVESDLPDGSVIGHGSVPPGGFDEGAPDGAIPAAAYAQGVASAAAENTATAVRPTGRGGRRQAAAASGLNLPSAE